MDKVNKNHPVEEDKALSKKTKKFLKRFNARESSVTENFSVDYARKALAELQESGEVDYSGIEESELQVNSAGMEIQLNIVRPVNRKESLPFFIFLHGGGWVMGDYPSYRRMVRDLVVQSGTVGVFVNYSLSPEAKYPQALNEIAATLDWLSDNGDEHKLDATRMALVGSSAGANLVIATAIRAIENKGPKIKMQILMWPVTSHTTEWKSYEKYGNDRFLTSDKMKWMFENYTNDDQALNSIYISPLLAKKKQLEMLPPTLIQVAQADILRDQGEKFGQKLDQAGVKVTTIRYNGMIHDFGLLNPLADLQQVRSLFSHASAELRKYLYA
jgi:acetyl esterase/lipase